MLKAFPLLYCFTSFSTLRFRGLAMSIFASVPANFIDLYPAPEQAVWFSRRNPRLSGRTSGFSSCCWGRSVNSDKLLFAFSLLSGQLKTSPPLLLTPKVKIKCNNTLQSALKSIVRGVKLPDLTWESVTLSLPRTLNWFQICKTE